MGVAVKRREMEKRVGYSIQFFGGDLIDGSNSLADIVAALGGRLEDCKTRAEIKPDHEYRVTVKFDELGLRGRA